MEAERTIGFDRPPAALPAGLTRLETAVERMAAVQAGALSIVTALANRLDELTVSRQRLVEANRPPSGVRPKLEKRLHALTSAPDGIRRPQPPSTPC